MSAADFCPGTGVLLGVCNCDTCTGTEYGTAPHRSRCGYCTGTINQGEPIATIKGDMRWRHADCPVGT